MVKNTTGGNNNKKFARKHASGGSSKVTAKLRVSEDEGELYAVTIKNLGNNMFHATATNGTTYLVHIRGKFSGRGRRDNTIASGVWVLIGLREWSNKVDPVPGGKVKMQQCDLLEVYSESDKIRLKDAEDADWQLLDDCDPTKINKEDNRLKEEIHWQTDKEAEKERLLEEIKTGTSEKVALSATDKATTNNAKFKEPVFDLEVYVDDI